MRRRGLLVLGSLLILYGVVLLLGVIFHIDVGQLCLPTFLILLGLYLIVGWRLFPGRPAVRLHPFPGIHREGAWQVTDQEIMLFVGDIRLDFSQAQIPPGETTWRIFGFVGSLRLIMPPEAGWKISSTAFLTDVKSDNQKQEQFVSTYKRCTPDYNQAERKVHVETYFFVADIKIDQADLRAQA
jgi:hypothetical protein